MFLVVCCAEASWSLYLLTFTNPEAGVGREIGEIGGSHVDIDTANVPLFF